MNTFLVVRRYHSILLCVDYHTHLEQLFPAVFLQYHRRRFQGQSTISSSLKVIRTSLIATTSPVSLFTPLYTTPKDPFPTCSSNLYFEEASVLLESSFILGY